MLVKLLVGSALLGLSGGPGLPAVGGYIGVPPESLGKICSWSTHIVSIRVEKVDREKGVIVFKKVTAHKGQWPDTICHSVAEHRVEHDAILKWAEPGKSTVMFALDKPYFFAYTYIDSLWYPSYVLDREGEWKWWGVTQTTVERPPSPGGQPLLLRAYCGKPERLVEVVSAILAGKEVVVPCLEDGSAENLRLKKTRVQRLKASLKLLDYNPKRDFVGWGEEESPAKKDK
jgi:hypothetical protein